MAKLKIEIATVKVMRSYDYCHFEVCLSSSSASTPDTVDGLRKQAARLADKAVDQYRVAKNNAARLQREKYERETLRRRMAAIEAISEGDRTVSQQAELKAYKDAAWAESRRYDYEDDWDQDRDDA